MAGVNPFFLNLLILLIVSASAKVLITYAALSLVPHNIEDILVEVNPSLCNALIPSIVFGKAKVSIASKTLSPDPLNIEDILGGVNSRSFREI